MLRRRTTDAAVRVAVGPPGAFVVTSRPAAAPVGPAAAAAAVDGRRGAEEVAAAAGPYAQHVHPVMCPFGDDDGVDHGVLVCGERELARTLAALPAVLRAGEVADLALRLETRWAVVPSSRPERAAASSRGLLVLQVLLVVLLLLALLAAAPRLASQVSGSPSAPSPRVMTQGGPTAP